MAGDWIDVCPVDELPQGAYTVVEDGGTFIAVVHCEGGFYAVEDICTHDGAELTGGTIEGCQIVCPRHGARFDLKTGAVLAPPAYEPIPVFPTRVENGVIQVRDNRWD